MSFLDHFLQNIPTNPLAWLEKKFVNKYKFVEMTQISDMKKEIKLTIDGYSTPFLGYGQTKRQCKLSAAKRAMTFITRPIKSGSLSPVTNDSGKESNSDMD